MSETFIADLPKDVGTNAPKDVQHKFLNFVKEIGEGEYVTCDPASLRITRKPIMLQPKPAGKPLTEIDELARIFDLSESPRQTQTIEYFQLKPNPKRSGFDFEHRAEVGFRVGQDRTELSSVFLNTPEGDQFGLEVIDDQIPNRGRKTVRVTGRKNEIGIDFSIVYDLGTGKLVRAELETSDKTKKASGNFTQSKPDPGPVREDMGESVALHIGSDPERGITFLLRMHDVKGLRDLIANAFPEDVFSNPSSTNSKHDASWLSVNWPEALAIKLTQNGKQVPLQF